MKNISGCFMGCWVVADATTSGGFIVLNVKKSETSFFIKASKSPRQTQMAMREDLEEQEEQESGTAILYDITGKQLAIYILKEGNNQLDFSKLEISGMVIYEIKIGEAVKTRDKLLFISR